MTIFRKLTFRPLTNTSNSHNRTLLLLYSTSLALTFISFFTVSNLTKTPDSYQYLAAALTFKNSMQFPASYHLWPPGFPAVLSLFLSSDGSLSTHIVLLNAMCFFLSISCLSACQYEVNLSPLPAIIFAVIAAFVSANQVILRYLWSEPLFCLTTCYSLIYWLKYCTTGHGRFQFYSLALMSFSLLLRHAGLVLLCTFIVSALWLHRRSLALLVNQLGKIMLFSIPYWCWIAWTLAQTNTFAGDRSSSTNGLFRNLHAAGDAILHWFFPHRYFDLTSEYPLIFIVAFLFFVISTGCWYGIKLIARPTEPQGADNFENVAIFCTSVYLVGYVAFVVLAASITYLDLPNDRYLAPIVGPMLIFFACFFKQVKKGLALNRAKRLFLTSVFLTYFCYWTLASNPLADIMLASAYNEGPAEIKARNYDQANFDDSARRASVYIFSYTKPQQAASIA